MSRHFEYSDGTDHINCGAWNECDGLAAFSAFCWFKWETNQDRDFRFFSKDEGAGEQDHTLLLSNWTLASGALDPALKLRLRINLDGTTVTRFANDTVVLNFDEWNSVGVTWSAESDLVSFYVNGILEGTVFAVAESGIVGSPTRELWFGSNTINAARLDGSLAEMCFWGTKLTDDENAILHKGIRPNRMRPSDVIGYWPLWGISDPEPNLTGRGFNGVVNGAVFDNHAPIVPFTKMGRTGAPFLQIASPPQNLPGLAFDMGSFERVLKVDSDGRLIVNSDPNAVKFAYEIGPFNRIMHVDEDGALIIKKV